jgi:hypothetical protein
VGENGQVAHKAGHFAVSAENRQLFLFTLYVNRSKLALPQETHSIEQSFQLDEEPSMELQFSLFSSCTPLAKVKDLL